MTNILVKKQKIDRILGVGESSYSKGRSQFDPRALNHRKEPVLSEIDIDTLADLTDGNCSLVMLMRDENSLSDPEVSSFVEVTTSQQCMKPKTVAEVVTEIGVCTFKTLMEGLTVTVEQQDLVQHLTRSQGAATESATIWHSFRNGRITASSIKDAVSKVNGDFQVINPEKSRSLLSRILGYYPKSRSNATDWGINNEALARKIYVKMMEKIHRNLSVIEGRFFIDLSNPFLGASPDGLVHCLCHGKGLLEIKCPWTYRGLTISEYAVKKESCLEMIGDTIKLKRNHGYFFQVQCQMHVTRRKWCDFFLCTSKDNFLERISYEKDFFHKCLEKTKVVYKELVMPELFNRQLLSLINIEKDVKIVLSTLVSNVSS